MVNNSFVHTEKAAFNRIFVAVDTDAKGGEVETFKGQERVDRLLNQKRMQASGDIESHGRPRASAQAFHVVSLRQRVKTHSPLPLCCCCCA